MNQVKKKIRIYRYNTNHAASPTPICHSLIITNRKANETVNFMAFIYVYNIYSAIHVIWPQIMMLS